MKIFDDSKKLKLTKIITFVFLGILFIWFTFNITGLRFGQTKIVTSAFVDEPIDFVFWLIFTACITLFVLKDKWGKYAITGFVFIWALIQYTMYFKSNEGIASYNNYFNDTHRIIAASDSFLVKDTYHLILDIFILFALITTIAFLVLKIISERKRKTIT